MCLCLSLCHRDFVQRCSQQDQPLSDQSMCRATRSLDHIIQQGVKVLCERLYLHIRVHTLALSHAHTRSHSSIRLHLRTHTSRRNGLNLRLSACEPRPGHMIGSLSFELPSQPLFDRLVKRKWLSNPEPLDQIVELIKDHFKKYQRMDGVPYHLLVSEVHRRVLMEYLRALMRGRIICTSSKKRKRMAGRLREECQHIKVLFKDLVGVWFRLRLRVD